MSDPRTDRSEAAGAPGHGKVRSEDDRVPSVPIVVTGIAALVIFFLASFVTISFLRMKEGDRPPLPVPQEIGQSKIGLVEQQLFESATRGAKDREARKKQLGSYGWVDRKAGVVRIPIERAMELSAQGVRPQAAPGGAPTEAQP
jgi:hypothetical protein